MYLGASAGCVKSNWVHLRTPCGQGAGAVAGYAWLSLTTGPVHPGGGVLNASGKAALTTATEASSRTTPALVRFTNDRCFIGTLLSISPIPDGDAVFARGRSPARPLRPAAASL